MPIIDFNSHRKRLGESEGRKGFFPKVLPRFIESPEQVEVQHCLHFYSEQLMEESLARAHEAERLRAGKGREFERALSEHFGLFFTENLVGRIPEIGKEIPDEMPREQRNAVLKARAESFKLHFIGELVKFIDRQKAKSGELEHLKHEDFARDFTSYAMEFGNAVEKYVHENHRNERFEDALYFILFSCKGIAEHYKLYK